MAEDGLPHMEKTISLHLRRERSLHRCPEQSFAIRAYAMNAVGIDVVSVHKLFGYRVVKLLAPIS